MIDVTAFGTAMFGPAPAAPAAPAAPPTAPTMPAQPATESPALQVKADPNAVDDEFAAWRASPERAMYDAPAALIPDDAFAAVEGAEHDGKTLDRETIAQATGHLRDIAADLGMTRHDFGAITEALRAPIDGDKAQAEALARLEHEHGDDAPRALAAAKRLAQANPRLLAVLNKTGLGDHPDAVSILARRGLDLVKRGKLSLNGSAR